MLLIYEYITMPTSVINKRIIKNPQVKSVPRKRKQIQTGVNKNHNRSDERNTLNLTITSPTLQIMYTWQCCESLVVHPYNLKNLKYSDYFVLNLFINHL